MKKTYLEKLKDPRWQKMRLKVLERDEFRCQLCWNDKLTLHVHHKYYVNGKQPFDYPLKALLTLCEKCHSIIHPKNESVEYEKLEISNVNKRVLSPEERKENFRKILEKLK
jgi:5-methylcytosine-specific restriction endonuclease McrA